MRAMNAATAAGYVLGTELCACGVDFSFTPVLDLDYGESSVIGDRSFGRDPRLVAALAKSLMHGLLQAGMGNCGKHFPGHGFVKADSHVDIPVDKRSLSAILDEDAAPYPWLSSVLTAVMPAHVIYPKVDQRPAGFSEKWLRTFCAAVCAMTEPSSATTSAWKARAASMASSSATPKRPCRRCRQAAIWCCCATRAWALASMWTSCSMAWMPLRDGRWVPDEDSESRRVSLLPDTEPQVWDELMRQPAFAGAGSAALSTGLAARFTQEA